MAKTQDEMESMVADTPAVAELIDLDDYCRALSQRDRRTTLLGGFHFAMCKAAQLRATAQQYDDWFAQFLATPT